MSAESRRGWGLNMSLLSLQSKCCLMIQMFFYEVEKYFATAADIMIDIVYDLDND